MLQAHPMRNKFGNFQNQELPGMGYGNGMLVPRRNLLNSGLLPVRGGLDLSGNFPIGGFGGGGGLGGLALGAPGLYGLNGWGGGGLGGNAYDIGGFGGLGGMGVRGRPNNLFGGGAQYWNGHSSPFRTGAWPSNLSPLIRNRNRGNGLLGNNKHHYAYPPLDDQITLPVVVQSSSGRRSNGGFGRACGNGIDSSITIPVSASLQDIYVELNKGKWDYSEVYVVTRDKVMYHLGELDDVWSLVELDVECVVVQEN